MANIIYNLSEVLGVTIIHSLWQGLLIWFALRFLFMTAPSLSAAKKHNLAMAAMLLVCVWFVYTFTNQLMAHTWVSVTKAGITPTLLSNLYLPLHTQTYTAPYYYYVIEGYLPYISAFYFIGLLFNIIKLGYNWHKIYYIKRTMIPADKLQDFVDELCKTLHLNNTAWVNFSRLVDVPCIIGYLNPVILLPITLTTYLSIQEVEAILLHELSHIKRNDYLLNLMQQLMSIVLFFNPFAHLINRLINQERENSCDDLVVQTTTQPLVYAHALLKLEQTRHTNYQLALAATGKKYHLLTRIERIMKTKKPMGNLRHLLVAIAIMAASISSVAWLNPTIKDGKVVIKKAMYPTMFNALREDTARKKATKTQRTVLPNKTVKIKQHNVSSVSPYGITNDAELEKLTAEIEKHSKVIERYFESPEIKQQMELVEKKGNEIADYFNRPDVRKLFDEQKELSQGLEGNSAEIKELSKQMEQSGKVMAEYYNSKAFTELITKLETHYNIPHKRYYSSRDSADWNDNYKKFQRDISKSIPADIIQQKETLAQLSKKMHSLYDTPEFKDRRNKLEALSDSLRAMQNNQDIKQQQIDMSLMSAKIKALQNNADIKREQKLMEEAGKKLRDYTNSPAFKKKMNEYRKVVEAELKDENKRQDFNPAPADNF